MEQRLAERLPFREELERQGRAAEHVVRFLVFPLLLVTGIAMWQAPRIRRLRKTSLERARSPSRAKR